VDSTVFRNVSIYVSFDTELYPKDLNLQDLNLLYVEGTKL